MPLTLQVTRGKTFSMGVPFTIDDLNAASLPTIVLAGTIGTSDISAGAITAALAKPGAWFYGQGVFGGGAYVITLNPSVASYVDGLWLVWRADTANSGAVDVNVDGRGAKNLYKPGAVAATGLELEADDIRVGQDVVMVYNSALDSGTGAFMVVSKLAQEALLRGVDSGTANAHVVAPTGTGVPAALTELLGRVIAYKVTTLNTGAVTLAFGGLTAQAIKKNGAVALAAGDLVAGQAIAVQWDGTNFQLLSPVQPSSTLALGIVPNQSVAVSVTNVTTVNALSDTFNVSAAITASGVNGLDTGTEANSTWYYLYAIYNGSTVSGLLSVSATAPTMPTGYTYRLLVGAVHNGSGGDFDHWMEFIGRKRFFSANQTVPTNNGTNGTAVTLAHNLGAVPRSVKWIMVMVDLVADQGYATGVEIPVESTVISAANPNQELFPYADATNVVLARAGAENIAILKQDRSTTADIDATKWKFKVVAEL